MTHEARFFSGDVMAQHWSDEDGGVAVMAAKKKAAKKGAEEGDQEAEAEADSPRAGVRHRQEDLLARRTIERTGPPLARDPEGSRHDGAAATGSRTELTLQSSVTYLLSLGLLDLPSLVRHGLQIEEVPGRNRNFRVLGGPGQAFFLKQAPRGEIGTNGPLAVEASLYDWVAADADGDGAPPRIPAPAPLRSRALDPGARPRHRGGPPARAGGRGFTGLPRGLAPPRGNRVGGMPRPARSARHWNWVGLPEAAPWVFDLARPAPASLRELAPAQLERHPGDSIATRCDGRSRPAPRRVAADPARSRRLQVEQRPGA